MQIHEVKRTNKQKSKRQIGRGGKRGTTSGRGTKGQKARAGNKRRPEMRDIIKKLPKLRGYRFQSFQTKMLPVNLSALEKNFSAGETVSPKTLVEKKIIAKIAGKLPAVKILGTGTLTKKLTIAGCAVSQTVRARIETVGGSIK